MSCGIDRNVWSQLAVVTDCHRGYIYNRAIVVCKEVLPDFDVGTVITVKRRVDERILGLAEQLLDDCAKFIKVRTVCKI